MKRYLLFAGDDYYPKGGWRDFQDGFNTLEDALKGAANAKKDWWHVVDMQASGFPVIGSSTDYPTRSPMRSNIKAALDAYAANGVPTGDFLRAVLSNDLTDAACRADEDNLEDLVNIVKYAYNDLPSACRGSPEKVAAWLAKHNAEREKAAECNDEHTDAS